MAPYRIALLGIGTVGRATAEALLRDADRLAARAGRRIELAAVAARTAARLAGLPLPSSVLVTPDPTAAAQQPGLDAVVELLGGLEPAGTVVLDALAGGRSVVTANKHLLASRGPALEAAASEGAAVRAGAAVRFEAAVGGGTPVLRVLAADLAAMHIGRVRGVVNGTTNWILDAMEHDAMSASQAVTAAQAAGFAEADPSFDLDGVDAADKLVLLARLAFGTWLPPAAVRRTSEAGLGGGLPGIRGIDAEAVRAAGTRGRRIRLVAEARRTGDAIAATVRPRELPLDDPLAGARGVGNVIVVEGEPHGAVVLAGPGAGGPATAAAVIADLVALARGEGSTWSSPALVAAADADGAANPEDPAADAGEPR